jgi:hypothetical protein
VLALALISAPIAAQTRAPAANSGFGDPLVIDGEQVRDEDIKLFLVYGPCDAALDARVTHELVEGELRARAKFVAADVARAGAFAQELDRLHSAYQVTDADVEAERAYQAKRLAWNLPTLDFDVEVARICHDRTLYLTRLRAELEFDRVFLPDDPDRWPAATREAVLADSGDVLIRDAKSSYAERSRLRASDGSLPREDEIYVNMLRSIVRDALLSTVSCRTAADGVPAGLVLWLGSSDGTQTRLEVSLDDIWKEIEPLVTTDDVRDAKRWFVTYTATRHRLQREGHLVGDDQSRIDPAAPIGELNRSGITLEASAANVFGFPSGDAYERYMLLEKCFERARRPELELGPDGSLPPALRSWLDRGNQILGLAQVDAEVLLVSARDIPASRWKPDGWSWAEKSAREIRSTLDANAARYAREHASGPIDRWSPPASGTPATEPSALWTKLLDEHSEYWDPPLKLHGTNCRDPLSKGRFGRRYYFDLMARIGETVYDQWVTGESIAQRIFFDQAEGSVAGPFKGPQGYYLTYLRERHPPQRPINVHDPKQVAQWKDLYLRSSFADYAREAVARSHVEGFQP